MMIVSTFSSEPSPKHPYRYDIDFWTTQCTRCPAALDKLDLMASDPRYENVQFISICCDKLDGAREIIEKNEDLRWQNVDHYFMSQSDKERAKRELGFQSVPFYVVLDERGNITQKGGPKAIDFDDVPGVIRWRHIVEKEEEEIKIVRPEEMKEQPEEEMNDDFGLDFQLDFSHLTFKEPPKLERIFSMDNDF